MAFISIDSNGNPVDVGQPGTRTTNVPDAPQQAGMKDATYTQAPGIASRVEFRGNDVIDKTATKRAFVTVRPGGSLAQASGPESQITDASGETFTVAHALRLGYIQPNPNGQGYVATAEYAELFPGDRSAPTPGVDAETVTSNTNTTEPDDAVAVADPFATEAGTKFVAEVVGKLGDSQSLYALQEALVQGKDEAAEKIVAELSQVAGVENFTEQYQGLVTDRLNAARSLVTAEVGLDAYEVQAFEASISQYPDALRKVREAVANGDRESVIQAAQAYRDNVLFEDTEIDPIQDVRVDGRSVEAKLYRVGKRWAIELKTGERAWLADQKVSRVEFEG